MTEQSPIGREWLLVLDMLRRSKNRNEIDIEISRLFFYAGARAVLAAGLGNPLTLVAMAAELRNFERERMHKGNGETTILSGG
jgi:H+/Cl- antiporter ClcA